MTKTSENLTPKQQQAVEWLALPKSERRPHTQELFAQSLNISEKTLRRWKKERGLDTLAADLARENLVEHAADFYGALASQARRGSLGHLKLALEMLEHYTEEVNVNVNHQREEVIRELSEFEERRRTQLNNGNAAGAVAQES